MMDAYKNWVRRNRQWISSFESLANTMTWFLPERFANSELTPETVSTLLGLVTVMNQHIIETTPRSRAPGGVLHQKDPEQDQSFPWSLCISVMKEMEVLTEMAAEHYLGKEKKWGPVASVEAIKALLRLLVLQKSGYRMLLDGGESKNIADSTSSAVEGVVPEGLNRGHFRGRLADHSGRPNRMTREGSNSSFYPQDLEGRAMQAMHKFSENRVGPSRPSWLRQQRDPEVESRPQDAQSYNPRSVCLEPNRNFITGEVLLIARPLLYVLLIWRYGLKSWRPWMVALSIDLAGMYLVSTSLSKRSTSSSDLSTVQQTTQEVQELRRRRVRWALYAMRSPFFDRYTRRPLDTVEKMLSPIPGLGILAGKAVELLLAVQGLYSYTSAS